MRTRWRDLFRFLYMILRSGYVSYLRKLRRHARKHPDHMLNHRDGGAYCYDCRRAFTVKRGVSWRIVGSIVVCIVAGVLAVYTR